MKRFAVRKIDEEGHWIHPAEKLYIAIFYNVSQWLMPAIVMLIAYMKLREVPDKYWLLLAGQPQNLIYKGKESYLELRARLVLVPGTKLEPTWSCLTLEAHSQCIAEWENWWRTNIAQLALPPDGTITLLGAKQLIEEYRDRRPPGCTINEGCRIQFVKYILDQDFWGNDQSLFDYIHNRLLLCIPRGIPGDTDTDGED
jgi:hypothetical protein